MDKVKTFGFDMFGLAVPLLEVGIAVAIIAALLLLLMGFGLYWLHADGSTVGGLIKPTGTLEEAINTGLIFPFLFLRFLSILSILELFFLMVMVGWILICIVLRGRRG
jgi:hypothetical protein